MYPPPSFRTPNWAARTPPDVIPATSAFVLRAIEAGRATVTRTVTLTGEFVASGEAIVRIPSYAPDDRPAQPADGAGDLAALVDYQFFAMPTVSATVSGGTYSGTCYSVINATVTGRCSPALVPFVGLTLSHGVSSVTV